MFFKMLINDIKREKGLNLILAIFMIASSTLVVTCGIQIYSFLMKDSYSHKVCNSSDYILAYSMSRDEKAEMEEKFEEFLAGEEHVESYKLLDIIPIYPNCIDLENFEESTVDSFFEGCYVIEKQSMDENRSFDLLDQSFQVENGTVALPQYIKDISGVKVGDSVWITTQKGNTYQFTVSHIYKEPMSGSTYRILLSDADFALLEEESVLIGTKCTINVKDDAFGLGEFVNQIVRPLNKEFSYENKPFYYMQVQTNNEMDEDTLQMFIITCFMLIISVFMILIILMTIRFTMISAIEDQKRELGVMKAIGVESIEFRMLFVAKYIGFSVFSGIVGIVVGIPLSKQLLIMFCKNRIAPPLFHMILVGIGAAILIVLIILAFSIIILRRLNKISVMEVLHGRDQGESFKGISGYYLNGRKKMPVFAYLSLSDIRYKLKKYLVLVTAYTLGFLVILCTVHLKDSVLSKRFERYAMLMDIDFYLDFDEELTNYYYQKTGDFYHMMEAINEELETANIPAKCWMMHQTFGKYQSVGGTQKNITMIHGDYDINNFDYREGSAPKLENEIALTYATAKKESYQIGDVITITYNTYAEDRLTQKSVTRDFVICGFIDYLEWYGFKGILCTSDGVWDGAELVSYEIAAPEKEKAVYYARIEELFGAENVKTFDEMLDKEMKTYKLVFTLLQNVLGSISILVILLITYLYESILLAKETPEIALLKSMGFTDITIRCTQMLRSLLLLILSMLFAYGIHLTLGQLFIAKLFEVLDLTGFRYVIDPWKTYLFLPIILIILVMSVVRIRLGRIKTIEIWNVREE